MSGATLNGDANPNGTSTTAQFQYGPTASYGSTTPAVSLGAGGAPVAIGNGGLTGLACQTLYHFRAVATNVGGTTNGSDATFTTAACSPPTVVTGAASGIGVSGATLNGVANPNGTSTTAQFQYGPTASYGSTTPAVSLGAGGVPVAIGNGGLTGLACQTLYHFRAVATNVVGTTNGSDATFTTAACSPPTVVTGAASGIGVSGATLNGVANPNGTSTTAQFQYGPTASYGSTTPAVSLGAGGAPVAIGNGGLTGLACQTLYHFRAVATNVGGTTNGSDATFTTAACSPPTVVTGAASGIGVSGATLNGSRQSQRHIDHGAVSIRTDRELRQHDACDVPRRGRRAGGDRQRRTHGAGVPDAVPLSCRCHERWRHDERIRRDVHDGRVRTDHPR